MNYYRDNTWKLTLGIVLVLFGVALFFNQIRVCVVASYNYERTYSQLWALADKSSTISAKEKYIIEFVDALKKGKSQGQFSENNAVWLKTPNNSFDANLEALETLSLRLKEIQAMDPKTFEYNTAIQQITAQEQGEASRLMGVFNGCYNLRNYWVIWNWIGASVVITMVLSFFLGMCFLLSYYDL